ncbi:MAG: hypothetical protein HZA53_08705 [Planctomycetes bacterium]|nr:hypothetical protein [Planctomycetota bacterium]
MTDTAIAPSPIVQLLEARAADARVVAHADRRFFTRYDAWTFPGVRAALEDPKVRGALSPAAKRLFVERMPELTAQVGLFELGARCLGRAVNDRVEKFCAGGELPAAPELLDHEREVLESWHLDLDHALIALAEYQERIFDATFPPHAELPSGDLETAFMAFASGALAYLPPPAPPNPPRPSERNLQDALNCEPDGWLFYAFAEFAWNASRVRTGRAAYWFALAQLFAALQEVHAWTYGPAIGPRSTSSYGRWRRRACEPIALGEIEALVLVYRKQYGDRAALAKRLAYNALRAFKDKR